MITCMTTARKHRGQPTRYSADVHVPWGASLARRGCSDAEIAEAFGVSVRTVYNWKGAHEEFLQAINESKSKADEAVAASLYDKACGKAKRVTKRTREVLDPDKGKVTLKEVVEEVMPPDTTAMIFWLKNRQPQLWRDRPKQDDTDTAVLKAAKELVSSVESAIE